MADKDNGGPAFPGGVLPKEYSEAGGPFQDGMTLRDYFAGQYISSTVSFMNYEHLANDAYKIADAMLEARKK